MNNTTAARTPTALYFDRQAYAAEVQELKHKIKALEVELARAREQLEEKQAKIDQIGIIAVTRLKRNGR